MCSVLFESVVVVHRKTYLMIPTVPHAAGFAAHQAQLAVNQQLPSGFAPNVAHFLAQPFVGLAADCLAAEPLAD